MSPPRKRNPLLGAAVVKAVLERGEGEPGMSQVLYEGILRDLGLSDADVEAFRTAHPEQVEEAIRGHGRR